LEERFRKNPHAIDDWPDGLGADDLRYLKTVCKTLFCFVTLRRDVLLMCVELFFRYTCAYKHHLSFQNYPEDEVLKLLASLNRRWDFVLRQMIEDPVNSGRQFGAMRSHIAKQRKIRKAARKRRKQASCTGKVTSSPLGPSTSSSLVIESSHENGECFVRVFYIDTPSRCFLSSAGVVQLHLLSLHIHIHLCAWSCILLLISSYVLLCISLAAEKGTPRQMTTYGILSLSTIIMHWSASPLSNSIAHPGIYCQLDAPLTGRQLGVMWSSNSAGDGPDGTFSMFGYLEQIT
jgi:hypothetical protein